MQLADALEAEQQPAEFVLPAKHTFNGVEPLLEYRGVKERLAPAFQAVALEAIGDEERLAVVNARRELARSFDGRTLETERAEALVVSSPAQLADFLAAVDEQGEAAARATMAAEAARLAASSASAACHEP